MTDKNVSEPKMPPYGEFISRRRAYKAAQADPWAQFFWGTFVYVTQRKPRIRTYNRYRIDNGFVDADVEAFISVGTLMKDPEIEATYLYVVQDGTLDVFLHKKTSIQLGLKRYGMNMQFDPTKVNNPFYEKGGIDRGFGAQLFIRGSAKGAATNEPKIVVEAADSSMLSLANLIKGYMEERKAIREVIEFASEVDETGKETPERISWA